MKFNNNGANLVSKNDKIHGCAWRQRSQDREKVAMLFTRE